MPSQTQAFSKVPAKSSASHSHQWHLVAGIVVQRCCLSRRRSVVAHSVQLTWLAAPTSCERHRRLLFVQSAVLLAT